ncbi:MAG: GatB/YqeY domain-containing protein [Nitrospiraceae bacterium]|nr:MAG: GatB/YqeY domain-containing protein [Nitrospiraceae bacterium]
MSLLKKLDEDLKTALKNSDKLKLAVVRMVKAAIKNQQIDKGRELQDEEILAIFSTLAKQRRESIEQFSKGGRNDLVLQETEELEILQSYMPRQLSAEEIDAMIRQAVQESSAKSEADIGKVMKLLAPRVKGVADGKWVNSRVRELLHG